MIGWLLYLFCCAIVVGCHVSRSFAAFVVIVAGLYTASMWWRGLVARREITVIGRDVPIPLPRALVRRVWWWL